MFSTLTILACATLITSCTSVVDGDGRKNTSYTGPAVSTETPLGANMLTPGINIRVGRGGVASTCTLGWIIRYSDGSNAATTAGHCARDGEGTPTSMSYQRQISGLMSTAKDIGLGQVSSVMFDEPYNHSAPNIALIDIGNSEVVKTNTSLNLLPNAGRGFSMSPSKSPVKPAKGDEVCWTFNSARADLKPADIQCGTVTGSAENKVLVALDKDVEFNPVSAGAPAVLNIGRGKQVPLGIVTDFYKDHIVIDTLEPILMGKGDILIRS